MGFFGILISKKVFPLFPLPPISPFQETLFTAMASAPLNYTPQHAPEFSKMVRDYETVTLSQAKSYARSLPPEQQGLSGCCKKVIVAKDSTFCCSQCQGKHIGYACPCRLPCGCMWTPTCMLFPWDFCIGWCICAGDPDNGVATCVDNKGNQFSLVKVDGERDTLAWWSNNTLTETDLDAKPNICYYV